MIKALTSAALGLALIAAPAAAFAQTYIGGTVPVSAEGLPYVVAYCEDLADLPSNERRDHTPTLSETVGSGIALHTVSLEDCTRAGLV